MMNNEASPRFEHPRRIIRNALSFLQSKPGEGPGSEVHRVGGGINVAVFPYDPEHPEKLTEQTSELMKGRAAYRMPSDFDTPNEADFPIIDLT